MKNEINKKKKILANLTIFAWKVDNLRTRSLSSALNSSEGEKSGLSEIPEPEQEGSQRILKNEKNEKWEIVYEKKKKGNTYLTLEYFGSLGSTSRKSEWIDSTHEALLDSRSFFMISSLSWSRSNAKIFPYFVWKKYCE